MVNMASQITHIAYANVVRKKFLADRHIGEAEFYVGNVFPDIRYLGEISREKTHPDNPTVEKLLKINDSFELGAYCHVLIDHERERALRKLGFYDLFHRSNFLSYAMKFVEDEITYPRVKKWSEIIPYFDSVVDEEVKLVPQKSVVRWHGLIQDYFSKPPNEGTVTNFIKGLGFDNNIIGATIEMVSEIKRNKEAVRLIEMTQEKLFK